MKNLRTIFAGLLCLVYSTYESYAQEIIHIPLTEGDATLAIRRAIESSSASQIKIVLEKGTYYCKPEFAVQQYMAITNHGNGLKNIIFNFKNKQSVQIEGNGATILCHGQVLPFLFENCKQASISSVTVNWDIPFTFLGEVTAVNEGEGWREIKPMKEGFSWKLHKGKILFPNIDGFSYNYLGSTLPFDKESKNVSYGAIDVYSNPTQVKEMPNGNLRIFERLKYYPPVGSLLSSKGDRDNDRYAPAFNFKECSNVALNNITIHHALGMGFLFERSEDIQIKQSKVVLPPNSQRVISTTADATHFANCKGHILIEGCRFENMLDDGTNVHGTYVSINEIIDNRRVQVSLNHFEQMGFKFVEPNDEVWLIMSPDPSRQIVNVVDNVKIINERFIDITFKKDLPKGIKVGDIVENKTWNPSFTLRKCTIRNHRARNIILKTPKKILIENNHLTSMMSAIQLRGDSFFWYESGAVNDVTIRNNQFTNCVTGGAPHAILYITPRLSKQFDSTLPFDRNIRFINNRIEGFSPRIVWANCVENLEIKGNKVHYTNTQKALSPDDPIFEFQHCKNVHIEKNSFSGILPTNTLTIDDSSKKTLVVKRNKILSLCSYNNN